ncbi:dTDP-4-dehydrorhamnose 3,5-epimerase family protein [Actinomycetota bacterium]
MQELAIHGTSIPGLLLITLAVQPNEDGWFKEDWHREKMTALGLPDFPPVQHNVTHIANRGVTRGFLAEQWDRYVSVLSGRAMGAWLDLREGPGFGRVVFHDLGPRTAVFIPRGVANAHQVLEDGTTFSYLMERHWTRAKRANFSSVNVFDPALGIPWPIGRQDAIVAQRDALQPTLADARSMPPRRTLVVGTETSVGRALAMVTPSAVGVRSEEVVGRERPDIEFAQFETIVNAFGDADSGLAAERHVAEDWQSAAMRARALADIARAHQLRYVHVTCDPVFESGRGAAGEEERISLNSARGQALAAGELVATTLPRHIILRTTRVIGEPSSFVDLIVRAARRGQVTEVPDGPPARLTTARQLVAGINHLLEAGAPAGVYNLTGEGRATTWLEIAREVYRSMGADPTLVRVGPTMPHQEAATLDLSRVTSTGFRPGDWRAALSSRAEASDGRGGRGDRPTPAQDVRMASADPPPRSGSYRVLFVCTANICRSAYADVVARDEAPSGVEFASAGTHALVGEPIDPPMAAQTGGRGKVGAHRAQQLTHELVDWADLILAMGTSHRRYILDEWPSAVRKTFLIGHVSRAMAQMPPDVRLDSLTEYLRRHRSNPRGDVVADPYRRGDAAAARAGRELDAHLQSILGGLHELTSREHGA